MQQYVCATFAIWGSWCKAIKIFSEQAKMMMMGMKSSVATNLPRFRKMPQASNFFAPKL